MPYTVRKGQVSMTTEDLIGILILGTWLGMLGLETWRPARAYPSVRLWRATGALMLLLYMTVSTVVPLLLPARLLEQRILDLSQLGVVGGAVVGFLGLTFVGYWYHRACHRFG